MRVSVLLPEFGDCLFCQRVINNTAIAHQYALRENPGLTAAEARERYLEGGAEAAPGVGPFTSMAGDFAVATLFDLIRPFRRIGEHLRRDLLFFDFLSLETWSPESQPDPTCVYCKERYFLVKREHERLGRRALGHVPLAS